MALRKDFPIFMEELVDTESGKLLDHFEHVSSLSAIRLNRCQGQPQRRFRAFKFSLIWVTTSFVNQCNFSNR